MYSRIGPQAASAKIPTATHHLPDHLINPNPLTTNLQTPSPALVQLNWLLLKSRNWQVNLTQRENSLPKSINIVANNLCLYCGASVHKAIDCPHAKMAKAKAASASESRSKPKDLAPEQKKGWAIHRRWHKRWIVRAPVSMLYKLHSWMQWTLTLRIHRQLLCILIIFWNFLLFL